MHVARNYADAKKNGCPAGMILYYPEDFAEIGLVMRRLNGLSKISWKTTI